MAAKKSDTEKAPLTLKGLQDKMNSRSKDKSKEDLFFRFGDEDRKPMEVISTGIPSLDAALHTGGFGRGRIIELFGEESSGKTYTALHTLKQAQDEGDLAVYFDAENALDPKLMSSIGINVEEVLIAQTSSIEEIFTYIMEALNALIESGTGQRALFVVDSVAGLYSQEEADSDVGDKHVAVIARIFSRVLKQVVEPLNKTGSNIIFINQTRENIGGGQFAPQKTQPGGKALKFFSSVRVEVSANRKKDAYDQKTKEAKFLYQETKATVIKNKGSAPLGVAQYIIRPPRRISWLESTNLACMRDEYAIVANGGKPALAEDGRWTFEASQGSVSLLLTAGDVARILGVDEKEFMSHVEKGELAAYNKELKENYNIRYLLDDKEFAGAKFPMWAMKERGQNAFERALVESVTYTDSQGRDFRKESVGAVMYDRLMVACGGTNPYDTEQIDLVPSDRFAVGDDSDDMALVEKKK